MSEITVILTTSTSAQSGTAPLTLILNPSGYDITDGPIVKIEYNFDDGTESTIVRRRLTVDSAETSAFAYPSDPGDPRNILVTHNLFPSVSSNPQIFNVSVKVTKATTFLPVEYTVPVYVSKVDAISGAAGGYFEDIHLISIRSHGTKNTKVMVFETKNPRYITFTTYDDDVSAILPFIPTPTPTPTVGCEYTLPENMAAEEPGVFDLSILGSFTGGVSPALSDLYAIVAQMSEDGQAVGFGSFGAGADLFLRDPGDTITFSVSSLDLGAQNAATPYGIDRNHTIVGEGHFESGG